MTEIMSDFLKFELLKSSIGLADTTIHDDKLHEIVAESNQELDTHIKVFTDETPLDPGSIEFGQIQKIALHYARMLWFNHIKQHDIEEREEKKYETKLEAIKISLAANRSTRQRAVLIKTDPRENKTLLPAQKEVYILDEL